MMLLSRFWYGVLSLLIGVAIYVSYVGVGQYNRRNQVAMTEGLASDSQVVRWALQIDARRRLDALLLGSVDKGVQEALVAAQKDKIPPKAREDAKKALDGLLQKLPPEVRPNAIFVVDRDGRVVSQMGYDAANAFEDFEMGGYPAVYDALHGYLRDDTWVLGGKLYRVVARPVEYDVSQPPVGAIVGLKAVDDVFAKDIARLTRTNLIFFAAGVRMGQALDPSDVTEKATVALNDEIARVDADKAYKDTGRSGLRMIADDDVGTMFGRLDGDAWDLRGGYAVARPRLSVKGPLGFLSNADDKDKANVPWAIIAILVVVGVGLGLVFSFMEHTRPLKEMANQAERFRKGEIDLLQLPRLRGGYRPVGQDLNAGIQRVAEKGGGAIRKEADLESILGPTPAQPAMSAFSFPMAGGDAPPSAPRPGGPPGPPAPSSGARGFAPPPSAPSAPSPLGPPPPSTGGFSVTAPSPQFNGPSPAPSGPNNFGMQTPVVASPPTANNTPAPMPAKPGPPKAPPPKPPPPRPAAGAPAVPPASQSLTSVGDAPAAAGRAFDSRPDLGRGSRPDLTPPSYPSELEEDLKTTVGAPPSELLAQSAASVGSMRAGGPAAGAPASGGDEGAEWLAVYEEFLRTKKECGEPTDGLTFDKFRQTLRKNRDALIQRHGCKRVKFSVYVKEGRASLKATPVKD